MTQQSKARGDGEEEKPPEKISIKIAQVETKRVLAIVAHLNQIVRTAVKDDKFLRPTEMDQAELLLAAASLRALFFDDTPKPILLSFLEDHGVDLEIEALETNLGLILLSKLLPEDGHVSDLLMSCLLDPEHRARMPIDKRTQGMIVFQDRKGLESMLRRADLWAPTRDQDETINSGLSPFTNGGPGQLLDLCRRRVPIGEWGRVTVGYLKHLRIDRKNIVSYVANKLGGVHYDSTRRPAKLEDADQFRALATGYDWDDQSLMHAGFVAVGLACIEVVNTPQLMMLRQDCAGLYAGRQDRLIKALDEIVAAKGGAQAGEETND